MPVYRGLWVSIQEVSTCSWVGTLHFGAGTFGSLRGIWSSMRALSAKGFFPAASGAARVRLRAAWPGGRCATLFPASSRGLLQRPHPKDPQSQMPYEMMFLGSKMRIPRPLSIEALL